MGRKPKSREEVITLNIIGELIHEHRIAQDMTQDEFGKKYGVSGPAIFKFEKGYVKPSLDLWLVVAKDIKIEEKKAVLMWVKARMPEKYRNLIDIKAGKVIEPDTKEGAGYSAYNDREKMREAALNDQKLPKGPRDFLKEDELWGLYMPSGAEVDFLCNTFGKLGKGSPTAFREALRLVREFTGAE